MVGIVWIGMGCVVYLPWFDCVFQDGLCMDSYVAIVLVLVYIEWVWVCLSSSGSV